MQFESLLLCPQELSTETHPESVWVQNLTSYFFKTHFKVILSVPKIKKNKAICKQNKSGSAKIEPELW